MRSQAASMFLLAALAAPAAVAAAPARAGVRGDVARLLAPSVPAPDARVEVLSFEPPLAASCAPREAAPVRPIAGSGRVAVKLVGRGCPEWVWARLEITASVLVTTRAVAAGEPLAGAVARAERRLTGLAPLADVAAGAVAARALPRGTALVDADAATPGLSAGAAVKVVVRSGALVIAQDGRAVPCARGRTCAVLPSGKHVEGALVEGRLLVELP